jgi:hypothetical protein
LGAERQRASSAVEVQQDVRGRETVAQQRCGGAAGHWGQRDSGQAALWRFSSTEGAERQWASSDVEVQQDSEHGCLKREAEQQGHEQ